MLSRFESPDESLGIKTKQQYKSAIRRRIRSSVKRLQNQRAFLPSAHQKRGDSAFWSRSAGTIFIVEL